MLLRNGLGSLSLTLPLAVLASASAIGGAQLGLALPRAVVQVMLGGQWDQNAGSYALALGAVPSKRIPELVDTLTERYVRDRNGEESFQAWCQRIGKKELKAIVDQFDVKLAPAPAHSVEPGFYADWGDPRQYIMNVATGECAGEVVSAADFGFTAAETEAFEAQLMLDEGRFQEADFRAYDAMIKAAHTLVGLEWPDVPTKFVLCKDDHLFPPDFLRRLAAERLGITPAEIPGCHCVALSHPKELADLLVGYIAG